MEDNHSLLFTGIPQTITLPTGKRITVREVNGEDEEILSRIKDNITGEAATNYLTGLILKDEDTGKAPTIQDVKDWPIGDKYYAIFKVRLINHGNELKFPHVCTNPNCPSQETGQHAQDYEQDLSEFDGDLSNPQYTPSNNQSVKKYPKGQEKTIELEIEGGRRMRFSLFDSNIEQKKKAIITENITKNTFLVTRNLEEFRNGEWHRVTSFASYSSRQMASIRKEVNKYDIIFDPKVSFSCTVCNTPYEYSLFDIPSFFWPEEL